MKKNLCITLLIIFAQFALGQAKKDIFDIGRSGTLEEAKSLFKKEPKAILAVNENGFSALVLATYKGNNDVAKFLIEKGSDINGNSAMGTPLMAAVVKGNNEIAKLLIKQGANLNLTDENGVTALIYAVQFRNIDIVKLLVEQNADKSSVDKKGKTAFEYAVFSENEEIMNLLK